MGFFFIRKQYDKFDIEIIERLQKHIAGENVGIQEM